jgi:hypothetical protein
MIRAKDDAIRLTLSDNGFHVSPGEVKIVSVKGVPMENILDAITVTAFER